MTVFSRLEDLCEAMADARIKQAKSVLMGCYIRHGCTVDRLRLQRDQWRSRIMHECGALARIAMKGKRQAMLSEEIASYRWADARFGNPGARTLRHYQSIRGFAHG